METRGMGASGKPLYDSTGFAVVEAVYDEIGPGEDLIVILRR